MTFSQRKIDQIKMKIIRQRGKFLRDLDGQTEAKVREATGAQHPLRHRVLGVLVELEFR